MRKTFQKWLFIFITSAFALTFAISFLIQTKQARDNAITLVHLNIADARRQLVTTEDNLRAVTELTSAMALSKARAFSRLVELSPKILLSPEELEATRVLLDVDELHISDARGILVASIPKEYEGYNMAHAEQSAAFLPALTDPSFSLVQEPRPKGFNEEMFQYAGVARRDSSGIVQIGYHPRRLLEATQLADIRNLASSFRIGNNGSIMIFRDHEIVSYNALEFSLKEILAAGIDLRSLLQKRSFDITIGSVNYLGVAQDHQGTLIVGVLPKNEMYISRAAVVGVLIVVNALLFIVIFVLVSILVQRLVINGIYNVNDSLALITQGDLEVKVNVDNSNEFVALSSGINSTVAALKEAIKETAARVDAELKFATTIQLSMLPDPSPDFPEHPQFSLCAAMHTAKEVGGDFYDYQLVDDDHVCFLVADVSGKGIPAALFMMTTKTLLHNLVAPGLSPSEVFTKANKLICENNEAGMFVTVWMGILELSTGSLEYVSAGHNPPLLKRAQGAYEYLHARPGMVLGGIDDVTYCSHELTLAPGDRLFLYTDGVTEAQNRSEALFGDDNLVTAMQAITPSHASLKHVLTEIKAEIDIFADGAQQADDITMLALDYHGVPTADELVLTATLENVQTLQQFLRAKLLGLHASEKAQNLLYVAAEEIFVNIVHYAYADPGGKVTIRYQAELGPPMRVNLQFLDRGVPYNPLTQPEPDLTLSVADRQIGGLGILITKKSMDSVEYTYSDEQNILTISKTL